MSAIEDKLKKAIISFFQYRLPVGQKQILIGFSGGGDSLCLSLLLNNYAKELMVSPFLAYLDHGLRPLDQRKSEYDFVHSFASRNNIILHERTVPAGELKKRAAHENRSLEDLAREVRYCFFNDVMDEFNYDYLALGHHQDDQMETMVMRFFQGSGVNGLSGMKEVRGRIIRPLLKTDKATILDFLSDRKEKFITDPTNMGDDFLRSRVRNRLMPEITSVFPGYTRALTALASKMDETAGFMKDECRKQLPWMWNKADESWSLDGELFSSASKSILIESFYYLYNNTYPANKRVPYRFFNSIENWKLPDADCTLLQGWGICLKIRNGVVFWTRDVVFPCKNSYLIMIKQKQTFHVSEFIFNVEIINRRDIRRDGIYIRRNDIVSPLIVRSRESGDTISLPEGRKSIKKLLNSWRIAGENRWKIPVIQDRNGILAVVASPWGGENRFSRNNEAHIGAGTEECFYFSWSERE